MSKWKKIRNKFVFENKWLKIDQVFFKLPNNKIYDYYFVRGDPVIAILGITIDNNVLLVKQYRPATDKFMTDIPGGGMEDGENSKQTAKREFLEETGYEITKLRKLTTFYFDSGRSDKYSTIYVGQAINKKRLFENENEQLKRFEISYNKLLKAIKLGKITEPTLRLAVLSLELSGFKDEYLDDHSKLLNH